MVEKRKEPRKSFLARAEVRWNHPPDQPNVSSAMIEDSSSSGMCIRVRKPISVGLKIEISWHNNHFAGV